MKLTFFRGDRPNFGDELNLFMWPRLLPEGFLDEDERELFVGIGSIILDSYPKESRKYVVGSGYGGYTARPDMHDGSWETIFVRGPLTARMLDLPPEKSICDSAVLLRNLELPGAREDVGTAFMPHFESLESGNWREACRMAGIRFIDPTDPVEKVIAELRGAKMLISEAMHGVIVADALRTPWVAVRPSHPKHHMKWRDWAEALSVDLRQHRLWPSSALEVLMQVHGRGDHGGRGGRVNRAVAMRPVNHLLTYLAAQRLRQLETQEPMLSSDRAISEVTERASKALAAFVEAGRSRHG